MVADDDPLMIETYQLMLGEQYELLCVQTVPDAKALVCREDVDVIVTDLNFEGQDEDGLDLIDFSTRERPKIPIIVLSGDSETGRVTDAMRRRIVDFVVKGQAIEEGLHMALERALALRASYAETRDSFRYKTKAPAMMDLLEKLERIVSSNSLSPILIIGEPGTGKEHLARHIGSITKKPVVSTNMANHGRDLADSALFGHVRGAFTGANSNSVGLVEKSHEGILFLDEIGEASLDVQAKLLRVVQEKSYSPVGSTVVKKVNVRFIAATNRDLRQMTSDGGFRVDLLERLSTWVLTVPALRDRPEDIVYLTNVFLNELAPERPFKVTEDGLAELLDHEWPGNIRELRNVIERITTLSENQRIDAVAVRAGINQHLVSSDTPPRDRKTAVRNLTIDDYRRALKSCDGNRSRAARMLGVHPATMFRRIIDWKLGAYSKGSPGRPKTTEETA